MKEKILDKVKILGIILILTFLISIPYLNFEDICTHDISYHVNRIVSISEELKAGNFPVLIHSNLLDGFGYANSIFYPELFLYFPAILTLIGIDFLTSYKLLTIVVTFFTLLFTFYSANKIFKQKSVSWIITILYGTAFYRLTDIYIRGAIGEVLALTFLPLILCGIYEIIFGEKKNWWIICFGIFGVINSHVLTFAMAIVFILYICIINIVKICKDKKRLLFLIIAGIISILLTVSFVFPYLEQSNNDKFNVDEKIYNGAFLKSYAVSLKEMINNKFYVGDFYKGIGTILLILPMFIVKCKNNDEKSKFMKQIFAFGIIALFMTTSLFPWEWVCSKFDFITTIQFPYRLNIIITLIFSFVGGYSICEILENKKELINLLYIILIIFTLSLLSTIDINSGKYTKDIIMNYAPVGNGEYKPYGLIQNDDKVHNLSNEESIEFKRENSKIEFYYSNCNDEMKVHIPFTYYKGYVAYIEEENGNKVKLQVLEDEVTKNVIVSSDKIITGKVTVEYKITNIQKISYIITLITFLGLTIYIISNKIIEYKIVKRIRRCLLCQKMKVN